MRKSHLGALVALVSAIGIAAFAGTASSAEVPPSVEATKALASSAPLVCDGTTDVTVTVTGHAGETGNATDIELVLDVSGSMAGQKLTHLKSAATAFVHALDARDGSDDGALSRSNRVGIVTYRIASATTLSAFGTDEASLIAAISGIAVAVGGSPHAAGITAAQANLASSSAAKAIVLMTDGLSNQSAAATAANAAKTAGIRVVSIGIGADADATALQGWATQPGADTYQAGSPGPIDANELVDDLGAAVAVPASFTVVESTVGTHFVASAPNVTPGTTVISAPDTLTWSGSLGEGEVATLTYTVTRDGADLYSTTDEPVSSSTASVTGGTATISPPNGALSLDVLPCGAELLDQETCVGTTCTVSGSQNGVQYTVNAGTPAQATDVFLSALSDSPPAGGCPGFDTNVNGVQFDIRPLTTDGVFQVIVPQSWLISTGKKWKHVDVCLGTNLKFTTKVNALATLVGDDTLPGRWWGLLPSSPKTIKMTGLGKVRGPWINSRAVDTSGNAVITFTVPYVANSSALTQDGKAAYDPKAWGG